VTDPADGKTQGTVTPGGREVVIDDGARRPPGRRQAWMAP
jgi:hypothetical protein